MESSDMNIKELSEKLKKFFSKSKLNKLAKECDFIIRKRKIKGLDFVKNIMFAVVEGSEVSLEYISSLFCEDGISVTKQSLHDKINEKGVAFMQAIFNNLCKEYTGGKFIGEDSKFTDVLVVDSSEIKLNKRLKEFENKQNGPRCKLQMVYGLFSNSANGEITKANKNDQSYVKYLEHVKKDNLVMFDLGYFCLENFRKIIEKEAYFVSRFLKNTAIMDLEGHDMNLTSLLQNSNGTIDIPILAGRESMLPCRLVGQKLTGEVLEKRMRKLDRDAKRSGKARRDNAEIDFWSVYITNLGRETVSEIHDLYVLRWQIELFFKLLKSKLSMGYISESNEHKSMIMIYGKLIVVMIMMILTKAITDIEISLYKAIDYYKERIRDICKDAFFGKVKKLEKLMLRVAKFAQKSKNKKRPSSLDKSHLQLIFSTA